VQPVQKVCFYSKRASAVNSSHLTVIACGLWMDEQRTPWHSYRSSFRNSYGPF